MVNRETLSKDQEKKLFSQFVEDYNTGGQRFSNATPQHRILPELLSSNPPSPEILCECYLHVGCSLIERNSTGRTWRSMKHI